MATATERFLTAFHDRDPGCTACAMAEVSLEENAGDSAQAAGGGVSGSGIASADAAARPLRHASSYHALASRVRAAPPGPVLDLACGDGYLLSLLSDDGRDMLVGVDLSLGELAAARRRLGDGPALLCARAHALPFSDAGFAAVTCHMALMLMAEPEALAAELRRVLQPGGHLLAVVPHLPPHDAMDPVSTAFAAALAGHGTTPEAAGVRFEGRCWRTPADLRELLADAFQNVATVPLSTVNHVTARQAWDQFTGYYDLYMLPPAAWPGIEADFLRRATALAGDDGQMQWPLRRLLIAAIAR